MNIFKNLTTIRDEYVKNYHKEISVFTVYSKNLFDAQDFYYHFIFSAEKEARTCPLLKKNFPNTDALFEHIVKEFFEGKRIVSTHYDFVHQDSHYFGICVLNHLDEKLNLYFSKGSSAYLPYVDFFVKQRKFEDNYSYAISLINEGKIKKIIFSPTNAESSMSFIENDYLDVAYLHKEKCLHLKYKCIDERISYEDLKLIFAILKYFLQFQLQRVNDWITRLAEKDIVSAYAMQRSFAYDFPIKYQYSSIEDWNSSLAFRLRGEKFIEISDSLLVGIIEKVGIVDELHRVMVGFWNREYPTFHFLDDEQCLKRVKNGICL